MAMAQALCSVGRRDFPAVAWPTLLVRAQLRLYQPPDFLTQPE